MARTVTNTLDAASVARLRRELRGDVLDDPISRGIYATDASIYQIVPQAVVIPRDREDVVRAVRLLYEAGVPIVPRGGGTSLAGQAIGHGVVLDLSKSMTHLLEVNVEERWARVEPGLVRDELNAQLQPHGLHFAPDPASSDRANLGGILANNAAGMRSIRYGMAIDHLLEVDLALADGEVVRLGPVEENDLDRPGRRGDLLRGLRRLIETHRDEIAARYPKVARRSGGYALDAFMGPPPWNLARVVAGSEGTLGVIVEAKIRLEATPPYRALCVAHFSDLDEALRAVEPIMAHAPSAVELLDRSILERVDDDPIARAAAASLEGRPEAVLIVEAQGDTPDAPRETLEAIATALRRFGLGHAFPILTDADAQLNVWTMRKRSLGLMAHSDDERKPTGYIEDAAVPLGALPAYARDVRAICERHGLEVAFYAHAGAGLIHTRPMLDLHRPDHVRAMAETAEAVFERVVHYGGAWSGEHGDGIVRGGFNERFFGTRLYEAFRQLKRLFDPDGRMNPGRIVDTPPMTEQLRATAANDAATTTPSMFHFRDMGADGDARRAAELCTGVAACRQTLEGGMCPSYRVTRDEEHSTRGRANALRLALTGQMGNGDGASPRLKEALDLCLSCKACVSDCPNHVDLTRLKAEAAHAWHRRHGATWRERMFRDSPLTAAMASGPPARLLNALVAAAPTRWALDRFLGIDRRRRLPTYAPERLSRWFRRRSVEAGTGAPSKPDRPRRRVALFADTFCEHHETSVGRAAVETLEAAGFEVELIRPGCCQRPALSKGFLEVAKRRGTRTMRRLDAVARRGLPILVCEPSCAAALADDLPDLMDDREMAQRVATQVRPIDAFLAEQLAAGELTLPWRARDDNAPTVEIVLHNHCHQRAVFGVNATVSLLRAIPGARVTPLDTGCCGMAGAFGYEKEHYAFSVAVAEESLLPALRAASPEARVAAAGFSCRHQIADLTDRRARHPIELVHEALDLVL